MDAEKMEEIFMLNKDNLTNVESKQRKNQNNDIVQKAKNNMAQNLNEKEKLFQRKCRNCFRTTQCNI